MEVYVESISCDLNDTTSVDSGLQYSHGHVYVNYRVVIGDKELDGTLIASNKILDKTYHRIEEDIQEQIEEHFKEDKNENY